MFDFYLGPITLWDWWQEVFSKVAIAIDSGGDEDAPCSVKPDGRSVVSIMTYFSIGRHLEG